MLLRIEYVDEEFEKRLLQYLSKYDGLIGVFENPRGNNPHYHFMFQTDIKIDSVRKALTREFPGLKGNKMFSFSNAEGNLSYLCKGPGAISKMAAEDYPGEKLPVVIKINKLDLSIDDISTLHEKWWQEAKSWSEKKIKSDTDNKFISRLSRAWIDFYENNHPNEEDPIDNDEVDLPLHYDVVIHFIIDFLTEEGKWMYMDKNSVTKLFIYLALRHPNTIDNEYLTRKTPRFLLAQGVKQNLRML